ncbi:hypothetical protein SAY87_004294 [Trapa incisa]|uniref:MYB transcription factor n=1 Tax=Trapa incisa TaxID=236973 RepID=A0AAN7PK74_9MYRT|nr:hypothetical protein SAY87_004294 [Trapa incisa]
MRKPSNDLQKKPSPGVAANKAASSEQNDQRHLVQNHGEGCSHSSPLAAGLHRCGKSCRLRRNIYQRSDSKGRDFGEDEEDLIFKLHALLGNRWPLIAGRLPGRTANEVKKHWNSYLRKKLEKKGIDPDNHRVAGAAGRPLLAHEANKYGDKSSISQSKRRREHEAEENGAMITRTLIPDLNLGPPLS